MRFEVLNVTAGDPAWPELIGQIEGDCALREDMWRDAEHLLPFPAEATVTVVAVWEGGRRVPAAWCASRVEQVQGVETLICSDNYERRGPGRRYGLYQVAYRYRHATIVAPSPLPARSFLFPQPVAAHLGDGWYRVGIWRRGELRGHRYAQFRRNPTV